MPDALTHYREPLVLIPVAAMFVIIFGIVLRPLGEMRRFAGVAMLFGLAGLLLTTWVGLTVKMRKRIRRSRRDDEGRE